VEVGAGVGRIGKLSGVSLVDNAFAAPGVNGCAGALALLIDPLVDVDAGLPAASGHNTAVMNGTVLNTEARLVIQEASLPELGRCAKAPFVVIERERHYRGSWNDSRCLSESREVKSGPYEWSAGAAKGKFSVSEGGTTFQAKSGATLTCAKGTGSGEYSGTKASTVTLKLVGCKYGAGKLACQSSGAAAGEIVTSALEGKLGFIQDDFTQSHEMLTKVGLVLTHAPSLLSAECGSQKAPISISGSVIGELTPFDEMAGTFTVLFSQSGGTQAPESFEEEPAQTLSLSFAGGASETAGLSTKLKLKNEEKLEIKGEV
jgi:hypothetical protein